MSIPCRNPLGVAFAAALAFSTGAALAGDITLFQHRDFSGTGVTVHHEAQDLSATAFNDTATSMVIREGVWQACTEPNFQGQCVQLQPGAYRNLNASLNHSVASVREIATSTAAAPQTIIIATAQPRLVLFENRNFGGSALEVNSSSPALDRFSNYDNAAAAIVYQGTWRLCSEENSRGDCSDFAPGRYENLGPLNGRVRSAELVMAGTPVATNPIPADSEPVTAYDGASFSNQPAAIDHVSPRGYTFTQ